MNEKSKFYKIGALLLALIGSNIITFIITQQIQVDADWGVIIEKAMPTVISTLIGIALVLGKQDVFNKIFETLIANATETFSKAATNVNSVTTSTSQIKSTVLDMKTENIELKQEISALRVEVKEAIKIKSSVDILVKKIDVMVLNDPNLIKNGVANKVLKVGESDEKTTSTT